MDSTNEQIKKECETCCVQIKSAQEKLAELREECKR